MSGRFGFRYFYVMAISLSKRIRLKLLHYINLVVGKLVDLLTRIGLWGKVPYTVLGHYGDVIEVTHAYPENYKPEDKPKFDEWKQYKTFPHDLFRVENVLLTSDGITLKKHRTFIPALPHPIFRNQYGVLYNLYVRLFYRKQNFPADKKYLLVYDNWSWNNYFHWVIDSLCRLQLMHDNVPEKFTVILPEKSPAYLTETLKLYGYNDILYLPENSKVRLPNLHVMNYAAWSGQQHPEILGKMVQFVKAKLSPIASASRRVYVSRSRAYSRKIENEAEVVELLKSYDFEIVYFEGMKFEEQVKLMSEVNYFVTSHGANMTNVIWLPQEAQILELLRLEGRPNFCYWSIASSLRLRYNYQLSAVAGGDNIQVNIPALRKNLEAILQK